MDSDSLKLALSRNRAHAGAEATTAMVAGSEEQGSVKNKHTVFVFEHRTAIAKCNLVESVNGYVLLVWGTVLV